MEAGRVVMVYRMTKLVQDDKIAQRLGKLHQKEAE